MPCIGLISFLLIMKRTETGFRNVCQCPVSGLCHFYLAALEALILVASRARFCKQFTEYTQLFSAFIVASTNTCIITFGDVFVPNTSTLFHCQHSKCADMINSSNYSKYSAFRTIFCPIHNLAIFCSIVFEYKHSINLLFLFLC